MKLVKKIKNVKEYSLEKDKDFFKNIFVVDKKEFILFNSKRIFIIKENNKIRGNHSHKKLNQFLICLNGKIKVTVDFGYNKINFILKPFKNGLHIPPKVWSTQTYCEKNSLLLVICDDYYKEDDYIRNYENYLRYL